MNSAHGKCDEVYESSPFYIPNTHKKKAARAESPLLYLLNFSSYVGFFLVYEPKEASTCRREAGGGG